MFFTRFLTVALSASTFGFVMASPSPAVNDLALQKRDNAAIVEVLNTLKTSTDSILPQIDALVAAGTTEFEDVTPLTDALTAAFNTAAADLGALEPAERRAIFGKRQSDDEIANLVAGILTGVTTTLDNLLNANSLLGSLLPGLDTALNQVLVGLERLLAGVLRLVAVLLEDVAALLRRLAFGLTLASLGF